MTDEIADLSSFENETMEQTAVMIADAMEAELKVLRPAMQTAFVNAINAFKILRDDVGGLWEQDAKK